MSSTLALSTEQSAALALARGLEADARDALDLAARCSASCRSLRVAVRRCVRRPRGCAEVDVARELAHDHEVEARDDLGLERRRRGELRDTAAPAAGSRTGPAPCECASSPCSGRSSRGSVSYCGPPTAPSSTASARLRERERGGGQRMARRVVAGAADRRASRSRSAGPRRAATSSTRCACADDLGADAVARQDCDLHVLGLITVLVAASPDLRQKRGAVFPAPRHDCWSFTRARAARPAVSSRTRESRRRAAA